MTGPAKCTYKKGVHQYLVEVIEWTAEAAREAVALDLHRGEPTCEDFGMGLWQTFLVKFASVQGPDRDIICTAMSATYRATVRECLKLEAERRRKS